MSIHQYFERFKQQKVLIVGDVMLDSYIWGKATRISPEAPVPIVNVVRRDRRLGGAANVALNIQALGATPLLCSVIGDDAEGQSLFSLMGAQQMRIQGLEKSPTRTTTIKHRILAGSQHLLRIDSEDDSSMEGADAERLIKRVKKLLPEASVLIFEDYDKGVLTPSVIDEIMQQCARAGVPTVVDPKKRNFLHYKGASLFKPNLKELKEGLNLSWEGFDIEKIKQATALLCAQMPIQAALITLSEYGIFATNFEQYIHLEAHKREIADVSGAGDTVVSIAALCLATGMPLAQLAGVANLGGGLVCEHLGVVPIDGAKLALEASKIYGTWS